MRSYATAMRDMDPRYDGLSSAPTTAKDLYRSDRDKIEEMRRVFARDLWIAEMRQAIR